MLELAAGPARALVVPDRGAALAGLWVDGRPVLRPLSAGAGDDPFAHALNILAPFSNRIAGGVAVGGRRHALRANLAGEPFPIHGDAFQRRWRVEAATAGAVQLSLEEGHFGPFRYSARLAFELGDGGFFARLTLRNTARVTLPFGGGFHPWFPRDATTQIAFAATGWWPEDDRHLPATRHPAALPGHLHFDAPRPLPEGWINAGFAGWPGSARILQAGGAVPVVLRAPALSTLILYSPGREADFFCLEPVSHPVDAHNLPGRPGLRPLAPGGEMTLGMQLDWNAGASRVQD